MKGLFFSLLTGLLLGSQVYAGNDKDEGKVPMDPNVKKGKLENGFTYYIRHNEVPKDRAEFYLFVNAGAVLEEANQNGLAHFCEHMAFNGTKHFPKKQVLEYMESIGVKFGHNVNAFTSHDMTVYNLAKVPTKEESVIDSSLLVLLDWADNVSYENEEIDKERGVIHEEWRTRRSPSFRMRSKSGKILYKGSKYAQHDVIGKLDVIDNCKYERLKSFYNDWYRPDLQAVAIVGDVDVDEVEKKIKEKFSSMKMPENPKERYIEDIPDNKEPLVAVVTDKEASRTMVQIYHKHDATTNKNLDYYRDGFKHRLYRMMFNDRINELLQKEDAPFIAGGATITSMVRSTDAYYSYALAKAKKIDKAIEVLLTENKRVKDFGFTKTELERNKKELLSNIEKQYKNRNKTKSGRYIWQYLSNFMSDEPAPGIEYEYQFAQKVLPSISLKEINEIPEKWITEKNTVVVINALEKEGVKVPSKNEVLSILEEVKNKKIEAYKEEVSEAPLLPTEPKAGKVADSKFDKKLGTTEWKLDNGMTVVLKPTDFKENEILMSAFSPGGHSLASLEEVPSAKMLPAIVSMSGVGNFSNTELKKKLAGVNANVRPQLTELYEQFNGNCEPEYFETMMKLVHLYFNSPREDKQAFSAFMGRYKAFFANKSSDPANTFRDSIQVIMNGHHPRFEPMSVEFLNKADFETMTEFYKERFQDPSDFTFFFVGNINKEKMKPIVEKYLGSIQDVEREETWKNHKIKPPKGFYKRWIEKEMKVPKASIFINYHGKFDYNYKDKIVMKAIEHILGLRYTETIREEQGGSYGVGTRISPEKYPSESFNLIASFDCAPEKMEMLKAIVYEEIEKLYKEGPEEKDLHKAKEHFLKEREEDLKDNSFWLNALVQNYKYNENIIASENYEEIVESLTVDDVKNIAQKYLKGSDKIEVVMIPPKQ
jgi:zinc protease